MVKESKRSLYIKGFMFILLAGSLGLILNQEVLTRIPQFVYRETFVDFLFNKQKALPWWEGGDCRCHGNSCFPEQVRNLSWEDAGGACGRRAWLAGEGQKTISMYPGWVVWVYTDPRGRENALCPLLRDFPHFYICDVTQLPSLGDVTSIHNMIWRTLPLGDERVSAFFVRDTDSLLLERGAAAVREWMSGNKSFHLLRDHPFHGIPVMGGLWGARWDLKTHNVSEFRKNLTGVRSAMIKEAKGKFKKGADQHILGKVLYPKTKGDVMSHDSYYCKVFPDGFRPFPIQREGGHYLGNYMNQPNLLLVKSACPKACRPKNHQDWTYC
ncbi:uncharacterized protein LOC125032515 isoform X2 [Penaeus chinensis]|uniref:uncharacterized protein LOC125032515 isoform X2 n=1 Tax=Penaeus chinensis TaxID=139456 RepID=UPI001FB690E8|nr:uncharacterized protein LOC125032515 isoform X2 [Penaeus chinensis]